MARHNELGSLGEEIACRFLQKQGYVILETNWRYLKAEVDIIASVEDTLIFVEVKTRSNVKYGDPDAFISRQQEARVFDAANMYIDEQKHLGPVRFDVIAISFDIANHASINHFKDALCNE